MTEQEFEKIYLEYSPLLRKICYSKVAPIAEYSPLIEEAIEDTFLVIYQKSDVFINHPNQQAWIIRTCMNRLIPKIMRYKNHKQRFCGSFDDPTTHLERIKALDPIARYIKKADIHTFLEYLQADLTDVERKVFALRFIQGKTILQIAIEMGRKEKQIRIVVQRIQKKAKNLRKFFK